MEPSIWPNISVQANTVCYETDTPDLARRERWTPFSVDAQDRWLNHTSLR